MAARPALQGETMTQKDVDRVLLVLYAVREAGEGGSLEQCKAICYCIRNRARAGWGEYMELINNLTNGADETAAHEPSSYAVDPQSRVYQRLLRDVDDIYFGHSLKDSDAGMDLEDSLCAPKHECLYWAFLNRPMKPQFAEAIVRDGKNHPNRATMGLMMFYE
jgi:hypothetical protein